MNIKDLIPEEIITKAVAEAVEISKEKPSRLAKRVVSSVRKCSEVLESAPEILAEGKMKKKRGGSYSKVFGLCVRALEFAAEKLNPIWPGGMDYIKINVILFCIVLPALFAASVALNIFLLLR